MENEYRYEKNQQIQLNSRTVTIHEQIKSTSTKEVYRVIGDFENRKEYILKAIYGDDNEAQNTINLYMKDKKSYFMEMVDFYSDDTKTFLLLKYYKEKTIFEYVQKNYLDDKQRDNLINGILEIGCYLHKKSYLHADIKPDNFFIDQESVKLGDLESLVELNNLQTDIVYTLCGTKGFKYSSEPIYSLKDELFAYLATIYYIEVGELLIDSEKFIELTSTQKPIDEINSYAREGIGYIPRESIREFLFSIIDELEHPQLSPNFDCCFLFDTFQLIQTQTEEPFSDGFQEKEKKQTPKWKKPLYSTLGVGLILTSINLFFATKPNTPKCTEAYFVDDTTIGVGDDFYNYTKDGFTIIGGKRYLKLVEGNERRYKTSKGEVIECLDGRVHIF